jgi:hypothetical protein
MYTLPGVCYCSSKKNKRCPLNSLILLMDTRYFLKLNSNYSIEIMKLNHTYVKSGMLNFITMAYCCGGHDTDTGYQCTKPSINCQNKQVLRCPDHLDQPQNPCDDPHCNRTIHQYFTCKRYDEEPLIIDPIMIFFGLKKLKCQYPKLRGTKCVVVPVRMTYNNEEQLFCIKHHCKNIKNLVNKLQETDIEFLRKILQPKTDLVTYQSIMSKIILSKCFNREK